MFVHFSAQLIACKPIWNNLFHVDTFHSGIYLHEIAYILPENYSWKPVRFLWGKLSGSIFGELKSLTKRPIHASHWLWQFVNVRDISLYITSFITIYHSFTLYIFSLQTSIYGSEDARFSKYGYTCNHVKIHVDLT